MVTSSYCCARMLTSMLVVLVAHVPPAGAKKGPTSYSYEKHDLWSFGSNMDFYSYGKGIGLYFDMVRWMAFMFCVLGKWYRMRRVNVGLALLALRYGVAPHRVRAMLVSSLHALSFVCRSGHQPSQHVLHALMERD